MNDKEYEIATRILSAAGTGTDHAIDAYVQWFIVQNAAWVLLGICFLVGAFILNRRSARIVKTEKDDAPAWFWLGMWIFPAILVLIGSLFVVSNIGDLFGARGAAIHQLVRDIRG